MINKHLSVLGKVLAITKIIKTDKYSYYVLKTTHSEYEINTQQLTNLNN
jgi:hypothetical protein